MKKTGHRLKISGFRFSLPSVIQIKNQESRIKNGAYLVSCILYLASLSYGDGGEIDYYSPENVLKFADHLYETKDYLRAAGEYQRYLFHSPEDADNTLYRIGLCYRRAGDANRAVSFFRKIVPKSPLRFAASYQIAHTYFRSGEYGKSVQFLDQSMSEAKNDDERSQLQLLTAFNYLRQRRWDDAEHTLGSLTFRDTELISVASSLRRNAHEGMSLQRKKPILAGLFSAVVPGTGKIYCKQYGDGIYSLILIGVTGLLAWDGFQENGVRSIRGWLFGSMGAVFYAGNVYGSNIAARIYNHQLEEDLLKRLPAVPGDW